MPKIGRQRAGARVARLPNWMHDPGKQKLWNDRFIRLLERNYKKSDPTIAAILNSEKLAHHCAGVIRQYIDKRTTVWLYTDRKARGAKYKKEVKIAIKGIQAAIGLYGSRGNEHAVKYLGTLAIDLAEKLERCKTAFATKRHGRDRAHSILSMCLWFLETELGPVTFVTLANLVTAGYEAEGVTTEEPVTEEQIRKNLGAFRRNNPWWRNSAGSPFNYLLVDPATK